MQKSMEDNHVNPNVAACISLMVSGEKCKKVEIGFILSHSCTMCIPQKQKPTTFPVTQLVMENSFVASPRPDYVHS